MIAILTSLLAMLTITRAGRPCRLANGVTMPANFFGRVVINGVCKQVLCNTSGVPLYGNAPGCRVCKSRPRFMKCKQGCNPGWYQINTVGWGCCKSFWSCGGNKKVCQTKFPCPYRGRRRFDAESEELDAESYSEEDYSEEDYAEVFEEPAYILGEDEVDEEALSSMTQEELDAFIAELLTHPHKTYSQAELEAVQREAAQLEDEDEPEQDEDRRRAKFVESMTESRLRSILEN